MSWVGAAIGVGSAIFGSRSSRRAAQSQQQAADNANRAQLQMFEQNRQDMAPWRNAGQQGLNELLYGLGLAGRPNALSDRVSVGQGPRVLEDGSMIPGELSRDDLRRARSDEAGYLTRDFDLADFQAEPGYQFRLQQGEDAINRNALARGRYNSGSALKALQGFNSDLASQEYGNAYSRFRAQQGDRYNRLASLAGIGQTATTQVNADRSATGNALAGNMIGAGNAAAAGRIGQSNAILGGVGMGMDYWRGQQAVNALRGGGNPWGSWRNPYSGFAGGGDGS